MSEDLTTRPPTRRDGGGEPASDTPPEPSPETVESPTPTTLVGEVFLPCGTQAPRQARRVLSVTLDVWGLNHLLETASLVLAELVTNAVRHAGGCQIGLTLWRRLTLVHISVRDCSRSLPCLVLAGPLPSTADGGRGLQLVSGLAFRWGTELLPGGKRVWAEITV